MGQVGEIGEEGLRRLYDLAVTPWLGVLEGQACHSALSTDLSRYTPVLLPQAGTEGWQAVDSINTVVDRYAAAFRSLWPPLSHVRCGEAP